MDCAAVLIIKDPFFKLMFVPSLANMISVESSCCPISNQGHLPTFGPALLHLYGSTRDYRWTLTGSNTVVLYSNIQVQQYCSIKDH